MRATQKDLPEGFDYASLPVGVSYGMVMSPSEIDERHVSLRLFGRAFCAISGKYNYPSGNVYWRLSKGKVYA